MAKTLTIDLDEYNKLTQAHAQADQQIAELRKQIVDARMGPTDGLARVMTEHFRAALRVAQYAMGMLSPEIARKWPAADLSKIAEGIKLMPNATEQELETVTVIQSFLRDIVYWDTNRNEGYRPPPDGERAGPEVPTMVSRATGFLKDSPGG